MKKVYVFYFVLAIIGVALISRFAFLQLTTDKYRLHANNVSIKRELIYPKRGYIRDRNGMLLAGNVSEYEIHVTPSLIKNGFDTLGVSRITKLSKGEIKKRLIKLTETDGYLETSSYSILENVSREDFASIQEVIHNYPAFTVLERPIRRYFVETAGHLLGFTREVDRKYIKRDSLFYKPGDFAGFSGVEKSYEKVLRGEKGINYLNIDRKSNDLGTYNNGKDDIKSKSGKDITLTIDYNLQLFAEGLMKNKRGGIVAIEPSSGEILALVSSPYINPNDYKTKEGRNRIFYDTINKTQFNRATQAMYPPGSPFKLFTALSAYQMGVIDSATTFTCRGGFKMGNRKIGCHCNTYWPIKMDLAISSSCNNYFSSTYKRILDKDSTSIEKGINEWKSIMTSFGFGNYLNNDLATGSTGLIPDSEYYNKFLGKNKWNPYSIISNGIGQGEILFTPIQLANGGVSIANKGFYYTPHIVRKIEEETNNNSEFIKPKYTSVDKKYFEIVLDGMKKVITRGTARGIYTTDFSQAGKTGTAQNPHGQDHSIFLNIAPAENPKIVIAVFIENGHYGSTWAAPISSLVAEFHLNNGIIKRKHLLSRMQKGSLEGEYNRQWIRKLRIKRWYIEQKRISDSIIENEKAKL